MLRADSDAKFSSAALPSHSDFRAKLICVMYQINQSGMRPGTIFAAANAQRSRRPAVLTIMEDITVFCVE